MTDRFVVTEISGFLNHAGALTIRKSFPEGLSCHVVDTAYGHKVMATFRTENVRERKNYKQVSHDEKKRLVRQRSAARASELNAEFAQVAA